MAENTNVSKQKNSKDASNNITAIDTHSSSRGKAKCSPSTKPEAVLPTTSKQNVQKPVQKPAEENESQLLSIMKQIQEAQNRTSVEIQTLGKRIEDVEAWFYDTQSQYGSYDQGDFDDCADYDCEIEQDADHSVSDCEDKSARDRDISEQSLVNNRFVQTVQVSRKMW